MTDFEKYIQRYCDLIPSDNWVEELKNIGKETTDIFENLSEEKLNYAYAEGKWTLKILLQHLIDAEKIFNYRALRFTRNDHSELLGWNEDEYAENNNAENYTSSDLLEEFKAVRTMSYLFFKNLNPELLQRKGVANHNEISVENIGKIIVGHNIHHLNIIKERYLSNF